MFELLKQHGTAGAIGALLGTIIVAWVQPTTKGGTGLLIFVSILACIALISVIKRLIAR